MYRALSDPVDALRQFEAGSGGVPTEEGNSLANAYHWIGSLVKLGQVDRSVTADYPYTQVFRQGAMRTYVAYNVGLHERTVRFSDGVSVNVKSHEFAVKTTGVER